MNRLIELVSIEDLYLLAGFLAALALIGCAELFAPARPRHYRGRSAANVVLQLINLAIKLVVPFTLVGAALYALFEKLGIFNHIQAGLWFRIIVCWILLDLAMYWLHRSYHSFSWLWRFHRVHHSDGILDLTTAFRTHPVETFLTMLVMAGCVIALGMPLLGVVLYQIIVAAMALWAHANLVLPVGLERALSRVIVTPGFHRLHHGDSAAACKTNYAQVLTIWDQIFGSFTAVAETAKDESRGFAAYNYSSGGGLATLLIAPLKPESQSVNQTR